MRREVRSVCPGQVWTGTKNITGRKIRIEKIEGGHVWYETLEGSWGIGEVRRIKVSSLLDRYEMTGTDGSVNGVRLHPGESQAVAALRKLAGRWPCTLEVAVLNGELAVLRAGTGGSPPQVIETMKGMAAR